MNNARFSFLTLALTLSGCATAPAENAPAAIPPASTAAATAPMSAPAPPADAAPRQPAAPYWSLQIASSPDKAKALATLDTLKDDPDARAEKRKSGWQVRVGAWTTQAEATSRLPEYQKRYGKAVRALQLENPVDWLLPGGGSLPVAGMEPAAAEAVAAPTAPAARNAPDTAMHDAAAKLDAALRAALKGGLAHADSHVYAADAVPLLRYAAARKDRALYETTLPAAMTLVLNSKDDPYAQGFVATRMKKGGKPESSDAGAMVGMAAALTAGSDAFGRADDRASARMILDGYGRHAYEMQGTWLVRHAFDFGSRNFSSGSLLVDYNGDFLAGLDGGATQGFGARSQALVAGAASSAHLLRPLVQPEVAATWTGAGLNGTIAPNNLTPLADACAGAASVAGSNPDLGRGLLAFATNQAKAGALKAFYNVDTGAASGDTPLPAAGLACLVELASRLDDGDATAALDARFTAALRGVKGSEIGTAAALLSAAQARGAI
jgi:hypothetical protein